MKVRNRVDLPSTIIAPSIKIVSIETNLQQFDLAKREMSLLAVFDLDYTIWPMNADQHVYHKKPLRKAENRVEDGKGRSIELYSDIKQVLEFLKAQNVTIGISSKDCAPELCREILEKHEILEYFDKRLIEIYPCRSKIVQFEKFWPHGFTPEKTIFVDDNQFNIWNLQKKGVHSVLVTQRYGATLDMVKVALKRIK